MAADTPQGNGPTRENPSLLLDAIGNEVSGAGSAKKAVNTKAIIGLAALAVAGGGLTYLSHRQPTDPSTVPVVDSTGGLKAANAMATGYDPKKDQPFVASSYGLPGAYGPDSSAEQKMASLQEAARSPAGLSPAQIQQGAPQQPQQQSQARQQQMAPSRSGGGGAPSAPGSILPAHLRMRLSPEYKQWMETQAAAAIAWSRADGGISGGGAAGQPIRQPGNSVAAGVPGVDSSLQNLYPGNSGMARSQSIYLPAGAEITCVTDHPINTDYPGSIRATVVAPMELKGGHLIVTQGGLTLERANAMVKKLVINRNNAWTEYTLAGEIRTDLPALNGIVNHHYARRILPAVANAGLAGGALYMSSNSGTGNISTQDQIYNGMVQSGVAGVQTEIAKINEGKPEITIVVPAGQEFNVLLTSGLEVK